MSEARIFDQRNLGSPGGGRPGSMHETGSGNEHPEIERRFLVGGAALYDLLALASSALATEQGYFRDGTGVKRRLRHTHDPVTGEDSYYLTSKRRVGDGRLVRAEEEARLSCEEFEGNWDRTEGWRVSKTRIIIPWKGRQIHLDHFADFGVAIAEIEFASEEEARAAYVDFPGCGREITDDGRWGNAALAKHGPPYMPVRFSAASNLDGYPAPYTGGQPAA